MNIALWITTAGLLIFSLIKSVDRTKLALKKAVNKFTTILALFILVLAGFALIITFLPSEFIQEYLGVSSSVRGVSLALGLGSISVMPGFAAFPLCAALKGEGIPFYIIAAFSTSLMNVGIISFPIEKRFLGFSVALIRNLTALVICIITVIVVKLLFVA